MRTYEFLTVARSVIWCNRRFLIGDTMDEETLERLPAPDELAWSAEIDTEPITTPHRTTWTVATAMVLSGIAIAGVILAAWFSQLSPNPRNDWSIPGISPVPQSQLPTPAPRQDRPDPAVVMAALGKQAATVIPPALSQDDEYLQLVQNGSIIVFDRALAIQQGHNICTVLAESGNPRSIDEQAYVARQLSANTQRNPVPLNQSDANHIVATAIVVYCPQYE